jgi:transposase
VKRLLRHKPTGFSIVSLDESVFILDVEVRRVWAVEGSRPVRVTANSRDRTILFGAISLDGRQHFRQYRSFNGETFLAFLKTVHRRFRKLYLFMDRASQHTKTKKVQDYLKANRKTIRVRWIPKGCPEFVVVEECWRQGEKDLSATPQFPLTLQDLKTMLAKYYRTRRFNLDMRKFLLTTRC